MKKHFLKEISYLKAEMVPGLPSRYKNLAVALEKWTKSAIKLSTQLLFYLTS